MRRRLLGDQRIRTGLCLKCSWLRLRLPEAPILSRNGLAKSTRNLTGLCIKLSVSSGVSFAIRAGHTQSLMGKTFSPLGGAPMGASCVFFPCVCSSEFYFGKFSSWT